jgi:hypothetical protein
MAESKTKATNASVEQYLAAIEDEARRADCRALVKLMRRATGEAPKMWGTSIVGFGSYHYKYESGREGDSCATGFSSRKGNIAVYLMASAPNRAKLLARLGTYKTAKACLYVRRMSDVDPEVLEKLVADSVADVRRRYG